MKGQEPKIQTLERKVLLGKSLEMNLIQNRTTELWKSFGPEIKNITNRQGQERFSLQVYPKNYFDDFQPTEGFTKWAAVEVSDEKGHPGLEYLVLEGGLYAVFDYRGIPGDPIIFQYIYQTWLPKSEYQLADRPHFEVLGTSYQTGSPNSEEEIWIPIDKQTP